MQCSTCDRLNGRRECFSLEYAAAKGALHAGVSAPEPEYRTLLANANRALLNWESAHQELTEHEQEHS
jgi:hypothetical protein